ncbi:MAG TPA: DUF2946 family protein [Burkholderiales bacterium]|nr:DUF2946 family protein [Burkholderiales bacterium]
MDEIVARSMAKWPDVPDVYGWLALDRRGNWLLKGEKIANRALRDFISRNYQPDARGRWYFQNGPQRVFVKLEYTPLVAHLEARALVDHRGRALGEAPSAWLDDEGSILLAADAGAALLDDRDLARYCDELGSDAESLPRVARAQVARQFGFDPDPA